MREEMPCHDMSMHELASQPGHCWGLGKGWGGGGGGEGMGEGRREARAVQAGMCAGTCLPSSLSRPCPVLSSPGPCLAWPGRVQCSAVQAETEYTHT